MRKQLSIDELKLAIEDLLKWEALEICCFPEKKEVLIPYCMNDGVEDYIGFTGCRIMGNPEPVVPVTSVDFVENESASGEAVSTKGSGVIFRTGEGSVVTVWYEDCFRETCCFQYHRIGHGWRKTHGEEYIRRLVNLICVMHDKMSFLGEENCSQTEIKIARLAEFAPVIYYTPINESILEWYSESMEGIFAFSELLEELKAETENIHIRETVGARELASLIRKTEEYTKVFARDMLKDTVNVKARERQIRKFAELLLKKEYSGIWKLISDKIDEVSLECEVRDYGEEENIRITALRSQVAARYKESGFTGDYPVMRKGTTEVTFVEEHPFTIMEAENYKFKIFSIKVENNDMEKTEFVLEVE